MLKLWSACRPPLALTLSLGICLSISSCQEPRPRSSLSEHSRPDEERDLELAAAESQPTRSWIGKVARKLRNGAGLSWDDDMDALLRMSRAEVVEYFMRDRRFFDTVLDFNLFFLGFKPTEVQISGIQYYASAAYDFPQALTAAKAVADGGDYFTLFDLQQASYLPPFGEPTIPSYLNEAAQGLDRSKRRALLVSTIMEYLDKLQATFGSGPTFNKDQGCALFISVETFSKFFPAVNGLGPAAGIGLDTNQLFAKLFSACNGANLGESFIADALAQFRARTLRLSGEMDHLDESRYQIASVSDVRSLDGVSRSELPFNFWSIKTNSSTNYNRKRAAAILKTYFCDDLTPVNIVAPDVHGNDQHGSDPSCQACHYKLDPMAGFFRDQGLAGSSFPAQNLLVFDDGAVVSGASYDAYMNSWKVNGSWNVGYVRSLRDPRLNSYEVDHDQPLSELFRIIREAPEVKACLVKRMSEFFISQEQVFDGAFLSDLTRTLSQPSQSSGENFKELVRRLMLSETFAAENPNPRVCYDPPGAEAQGALCEVAFIIKTRCAACHAEGFALDDPTVQAKMLDRLQSPDPERRMPLRMDMPDTERVALIKWLSESP